MAAATTRAILMTLLRLLLDVPWEQVLIVYRPHLASDLGRIRISSRLYRHLVRLIVTAAIEIGSNSAAVLYHGSKILPLILLSIRLVIVIYCTIWYGLPYHVLLIEVAMAHRISLRHFIKSTAHRLKNGIFCVIPCAWVCIRQISFSLNMHLRLRTLLIPGRHGSEHLSTFHCILIVYAQ